MITSEELETRLPQFRVDFHRLKQEVQKAIVGYDDLLTETLAAIFSQGHVLLEGVPGLGKTYLVKILSRVFGLEAGRIQCTPDLMPADILGTQIVQEDEHGRRSLHFEKGPVFRNIVLVDEINRATPKTQAALLEVMQERNVTTGGQRFPLPSPFFVMATQNPMEMEGTYPLPEAQLDRFLFKILAPFPKVEDLVEISRRTTGASEPDIHEILTGQALAGYQQLLAHVPIADPLARYAAELVLATHPDHVSASAEVKRYVSYGSSPRGMQALVRGARVVAVLDGRSAVSADDIRKVALPSLRHRVILNFEGEAESLKVDRLIADVINAVPTPAARVS
jgi:MoxR-like ATPase